MGRIFYAEQEENIRKTARNIKRRKETGALVGTTERNTYSA